MPSFDVVSETNMEEVANAVNGAKREMQNRFDFRGSKAEFTLEDDKITVLADDDMKLKAMIDMLKTYLTRRNVDAKCLEFETVEKASGGMLRQPVKIKNGIDQENAKKITKYIKDSKMKVQASIQGEQVRVTGKNRDDLQAAIALIKEAGVELPLQFNNFRD